MTRRRRIGKSWIQVRPAKVPQRPRGALGILIKDTDLERLATKRFRRFIETEFRNLAQLIQKHEQNTVWRD